MITHEDHTNHSQPPETEMSSIGLARMAFLGHLAGKHKGARASERLVASRGVTADDIYQGQANFLQLHETAQKTATACLALSSAKRVLAEGKGSGYENNLQAQITTRDVERAAIAARSKLVLVHGAKLH